MPVLMKTDLPNLLYRGKVRDTFDLGKHLLIVATDRISAFDVVLPNGIPDKGKVLNQLSVFWFEKTAHLVPNHLVEGLDDIRLLEAYARPEECIQYPHYLEGRSMIVRKAERVNAECVVRGYISGSAWAEYKEGGTVNGQPMPRGLVESQKLPSPMFTPTTKADSGHDQPLTLKELGDAVGRDLALKLEANTIALYESARDYALERGIILADTKLEFGFIEGELCVIDEMFTPDSSRFWDASSFEPGRSQPSFDKQPVRDWLTASGWSKEPPAPALPSEVVEQTAQRYREAYRRLTGKELS